MLASGFFREIAALRRQFFLIEAGGRRYGHMKGGIVVAYAVLPQAFHQESAFEYPRAGTVLVLLFYRLSR